MFDLDKLIRPNVKAMRPYSSAREDFVGDAKVFMDANESPFDNGVNRYPDPFQKELKLVLAEQKKVDPENILLGNGSDEVLDLLFRAFCMPEKDNVVLVSPTYGMYEVLADLNQIEVRKSWLSKDFELDVEAIKNEVDENTKMIFICSPNNPTGNAFEFDQIKQVLDVVNCLVVVDEAYVEFVDSISSIENLSKEPQLVGCQTFSKALGAAGIRLGVLYSSVEIVEVLNKIKPPYNVNQLTINYALDLLNNRSKIDAEIKVVQRQKKILVDGLKMLSNVEKVFPSDANFLLVRFKDADRTYNALLEQGIVVRNRSNVRLCENCLRISIGTADQNEQLIEKLKIIENEESLVY